MFNIVENLKNFLNENKYQDIALDNFNEYGSFDYLREIDKLALLSNTKENDLKRLSLKKIYQENDNSFGDFIIKVKVKPAHEQLVVHKISKDYANKYGYLFPSIGIDNQNREYVDVDFGDIQLPIYLKNMFPVSIDDNYERNINILFRE